VGESIGLMLNFRELIMYDRVLIVASGHTAIETAQHEDKVDCIVVVNNAWSVTDKWRYWIHPGDYIGSRPNELLLNQVEISNYQTSLSKYGGQGACGYSITLNASYWVLDQLSPSQIYYLGADMIYNPDQNGNTHFYGTGRDIQKYGTSDPDIMVRLHSKGDVNYLENIYLRFMKIANENGCELHNLSSNQNTRLPYPQVNSVLG
jgi:hypothetical protein